MVTLLVLAACGGGSPAVAPTAIPQPTATPEPTATPKPAFPDPKTDPLAALLYTSVTHPFKTAEFNYEMTMAFKPGDEASAEQLKPVLEQLNSNSSTMTGEGAMAIIDASAGTVNMRMTLELAIAGQTNAVEMVMVDGETWVRLGGEGQTWQKSDQAATTLSPSLNPTEMAKMLESASAVSWVEETELAGARVHHVHYTLDPSKLDIGQLLASAGSGQVPQEQLATMVKEMTVAADVWLSAENLEMRQQRMVISIPLPLPAESGMEGVKLNMDMDMVMRYTRLNEPVTIEAPAQ
jgi:hypothetical protein